MDYKNTDAWGKRLLWQLLLYADVAKFLLQATTSRKRLRKVRLYLVFQDLKKYIFLFIRDLTEVEQDVSRTDTLYLITWKWSLYVGSNVFSGHHSLSGEVSRSGLRAALITKDYKRFEL